MKAKNSPLNMLLQSPLFRLLFLLPLLGGILTSCTEDVDRKNLPKGVEKLVVVSFISPEDSVLEAVVTKSQPIIGSKFYGTPLYINNATVTISDGSREVELVFNPGTMSYTSTAMQIEPGKTYFLKAGTPGGFRTSASCTVPAKKCESITASVDSIQGSFGTETDHLLRAFWDDLPGQGDYFRIDAEMQLEPEGGERKFNKLNFDEPVFEDMNKDGRSFRAQSNGIGSLQYWIELHGLTQINCYLMTCDVNYYKYHQTLSLYQLTNSFSEPVFMHSNIQGGLGVFGAYRRHSIVVPVK